MILLNSTKTKIRVLYWGGFVLFMVLVVIPLFFFFYLFNENQVRQTIINQFDDKVYNVEIDGQIVPKPWHGMSLDLNRVVITTKRNVQLVEIKRMSCKMSWLGLIFGKYKVKRVAIDGMDINQGNLKQYGVSNLLNLSNAKDSLFSDMERVDIYGINSVEKDLIYPIRDGSFKIEHNGLDINFDLGFKLKNSQTYFIVNGVSNAVNNDLINFDTFNIHIFNSLLNIDVATKASYSINAKNLSLQNIIGNVHVKNYVGTLNVGKVDVNLNGITASNADLQVDFTKNSIGNHILFNVDKLISPQYKGMQVNKISMQYKTDIPNIKFNMDSMVQNLVYSESMGIYSDYCTSQMKLTSSKLKDNGLNSILTGKCAYDINKNALRFNLDGNLNSAPLKLDLQVFNDSIKPYIIATGNIASLDLSRLTFAKDKMIPLFSDKDRLPFAWLSLFNAQANLIIKHFVLDRIALNDVTTDFIIKNDELNIKHIKANVYNGALSGGMKITKHNDVYDLYAKNSISNLNLKNLLDNLFDISAISGTGNLMLDIMAKSVSSYDDIHRHLNGKVNIEAKNGAFQGVDFNLFLNPESGIAFTSNRSTIVNHMQANFNFANGVSKNGTLQFSSPYVIATGIGSLDFIHNTLNYNLNIKSALPKNDQRISLVVIPVSIAGDILSPKLSIQHMHLISESRNKTKVVTQKSKPSSHRKP
jgi:uncharacterized protein involved in outer membrane biogenesis